MQAQAWHGVQVVERLLVRVPKGVAHPARDDGNPRLRGIEQGRTRAGPRSVMPDLQHVDPGQEAAVSQHCLDRHVRVPGEQGRKAAVAKQPDHRCIVDVALRQGGRNVIRRGIQQGEDRPGVEAQALAGACRHQSTTRLRAGQPQEQGIGRVCVVATRVEDQANLISLESGHQPGDVVLVRVGQDQDVDAAVPPRQPLPEPAQQEIRIRATVDQHGRPRRRHDQDRIALSYVQGDQMKLSVGHARRGEPDQQHYNGNDPRHRPAEEPDAGQDRGNALMHR